MIIIMGAGISGLLLAQRMKEAKRRYLILDKGGPMSSGNDQGFFYSHEENPFTRKESFKIVSDACEGGTVEKYAAKVYGDPKANLDTSSFARFGIKGQIVTGNGWAYSREILADGVEVIKSEVYHVDIESKLIHDSSGRCWKYSTLLSTIPLPILSAVAHCEDTPIGHFISVPRFCSKPIYILSNSTDSAEYGVMSVKYCASSCHPWYRSVTSIQPGYVGQYTEEHAQEIGDGPESFGRRQKLYPGKIWIHDDKDRNDLERMKLYLKRHGVLLYGRYGEWRPKGLTSHVWAESASLGKDLP